MMHVQINIKTWGKVKLSEGICFFWSPFISTMSVYNVQILGRLFSARFGVSTAVLIKFRVFCDITTRRLLKRSTLLRHLCYPKRRYLLKFRQIVTLKRTYTFYVPYTLQSAIRRVFVMYIRLRPIQFSHQVTIKYVDVASVNVLRTKKLLIYFDFSLELLPTANKLTIAKHSPHRNFV
jgi:hypothetical protein